MGRVYGLASRSGEGTSQVCMQGEQLFRAFAEVNLRADPKLNPAALAPFSETEGEYGMVGI